MNREEELEQQVERTTALNKLLLDTSKSQSGIIKHFKSMLITLMLCFSVIICVMVGGFFWYKSQYDTTTATTTTTSMETSGKDANINNATDGDVYNDNAVHSSK